MLEGLNGLFDDMPEYAKPEEPFPEGYELMKKVLEENGSSYDPIDVIGMGFEMRHPENAPWVPALYLTYRGWKESQSDLLLPDYQKLFSMTGTGSTIGPLWLAIRDKVVEPYIDNSSRPPFFANLGGKDGMNRVLIMYSTDI